MSTANLNRRDFIAASLAAGSGLYLGSSVASAARPGQKVRVAFVGIGGRGSGNVRDVHASGLAKFVAFCDLDPSLGAAKKVVQQHPDVPLYGDYRVMLDAVEDEIDAVVVTTPDHAHFPIAMEAIRRGKHVYCEKPLAHTFREIELLMAAAAAKGVVTQMGNQGHSGPNYMQAKAWSEAGVFDGIDRVVGHMNKSRRWFPWGVVSSYPSEPVKEGVDWDLWLMSRPEVPYSRKLHSANWRAWYDFGGGAFGDWGAHLLDTAHRFLELGFPERIKTVTLDDANDPADLIYPLSSTIRMEFPARGRRPAVALEWYDGLGNVPEDPKFGNKGPDAVGKVWKDRERIFKGGSHGSPLQAKYADGSRVDGLPDYGVYPHTHQTNFLRACLGLEEAHSPFSVGGPLCQMLILGQLAQRYGGEFRFDRGTERCVGANAALANAYLDGPPVRSGWEDYYRS
ncbi:MAG: Gfo/Idh/MocA family oxidoreductase [Planctomycetota bacterium]